MRPLAALLLLAGTPVLQDPAVPRAFDFSFTQEWTIRAEYETNLVFASTEVLTKGLRPAYRVPTQNDPFGTTVILDAPPVRKRKRPAGLPAGIFPGVRKSRASEIEIEGRFERRGKDVVVFSFKRMEFATARQKWSIDFLEDKIRAHQLAGTSRWTGTREEWTTRLGELERLFIDAYQKIVSPQPAGSRTAGINISGLSAPEPGGRLFAACSLETQLALLLLARLDGAVLEGTLWPKACAAYPRRVIPQARSLVDRLLFQSEGELAPAAARRKRSRSVKNVPWASPLPALPSFHWKGAPEWNELRAKEVEQAATGLRKLADRSRLTVYMTRSYWDEAVRTAIERLGAAGTVSPIGWEATLEDKLGPRALNAGRGTFDYKERLSMKDGRLGSSRADVYGLVGDWDVAFFHSGANRWRVSRIRYETSYKGEVKPR